MSKLKIIYTDELENIIEIIKQPEAIPNVGDIVGFVRDGKTIRGVVGRKSIFHNMNHGEVQVAIMFERDKTI